MNDEIDHEEIIDGKPPSKNDLFYLEWGRETLKENIAILNDTFKLFITLDTVLISAYLGFYDSVLGNTFPASWQTITPAVCVILSLLASVIGIYPFSKSVKLSIPDDVKSYKEKRLRFKSVWLAISVIALISGFVILLFVRVTLPYYLSGQVLSPTPTP